MSKSSSSSTLQSFSYQLQRSLTEAASEKSFNAFKEAAKVDGDTITLAQLNSYSDSNSNRWLSVIPTDTNFILRDNQFKSAARLRLASEPMESLPLITQCPLCNRSTEFSDRARLSSPTVDKFHCLSCDGMKAAISKRHNMIAATVAQYARQSGITTFTEPSSLSSTDKTRPDIQMFINGQNLLVDVTVRNPLASSYLDRSASHPQSLLQKAEKEKTQKYRQMAIDNDAVFEPFAVDTLGVLGKSAIKVIQQISKAAEENYSAHSFAETFQSLLSAVAIAIQRGNAMVISQYSIAVTQYYSNRNQQQFRFDAPVRSIRSSPPNTISSPNANSCSLAARLERNNSICSGVSTMPLGGPSGACA